ncbi:MAG TPA: hypothetical protein VF526_18900 [Solirubrobacteraceae bacterium]
MNRRPADPTPALAKTRSRAIADELKTVIRLAGRDPEALEGELPALSALYRVSADQLLDEPARVHFILRRLIPEYLQRLPAGRDCRAIRELMTWQDTDGEIQSLTTRYHKAAAHLVGSASDFGRRQEPRLLLECARRFIALDHEDRLGPPPPPAAVACAVPADTPVEVVAQQPLLTDGDPRGGVVRVHRNLDYHRLIEHMAGADEIVMLNTWIPGLDILADALVDALAGGTYVSILLLHPESHIAQLRSQALQGAVHRRFGDDMVRPGVRHCLDVLAAVSSMVDDECKRNLRVRLYSSLPSVSVYGIDDRAFVSFFLHGQLAVKSTQIEVLGQDSVMGQLVFGELKALWNIGQEVTDIAQWQNETRERVRAVPTPRRSSLSSVAAPSARSHVG